MKKRTILWGLMTLGVMCFIFFNSLRPAPVSSAQSSRIMGLLLKLLPGLSALPEELLHHVVRKAAHFTEFAALGFCAAGTWKSRNGNRKGLGLIFVYLAAVPLTDESIQYFVPGRAAAFSDAALDFSGAVAGLAVLLLLWQLFKLIRERERT